MVGLGWFHELDLDILLIVICVLLIIVSQLGYFFGARSRHRGNKTDDLADFIPASMLGLLSLILGFTFLMAINRFEYRKELVIKEADAIEMVYLRSKLLNGEHSVQIANILKSYVDARLEFTGAGDDETLILRAENKTKIMHNMLWDVAVQATKLRQGVVESLLIVSLNELITMQKRRFLALHNRIPGSVYWTILLIACIGLFTYNFSNGIQGKAQRWAAILLALLFSVVFLLINDLDRPRSGTISVSQEAMEVLRKTLNH